MADGINIARCSPVQMRRSLELAETLKKFGLDFVPVPTLNADDRRRLLDDCEARLGRLLEEAEKGEK